MTLLRDFLCLCSPDLGEKDKWQYKDEDLPGTAAEGSVCHPATVGCVKHYPTSPQPPSVHLSIHPPAQPHIHRFPIWCVSVEFDMRLLILHHIHKAPHCTQTHTVFRGHGYVIWFLSVLPNKLDSCKEKVIFKTVFPTLFVTMWHVCEAGQWSLLWFLSYAVNIHLFYTTQSSLHLSLSYFSWTASCWPTETVSKPFKLSHWWRITKEALKNLADCICGNISANLTD